MHIRTLSHDGINLVHVARFMAWSCLFLVEIASACNTSIVLDEVPGVLL